MNVPTPAAAVAAGVVPGDGDVLAVLPHAPGTQAGAEPAADRDLPCG